MASDPKTLVDLLERTCVSHEQRPCLGRKVGSRFEWITYGELCRDVAQARHLLELLGIGPSDHVAIIADNCPEWAILCYAAAGRCAVFVPMYTAQTEVDWLHILNDCKARVCFTGTRSIHEKVLAVREKLPQLEHVISLQGSTDDPTSFHSQLAQCDLSSTPPKVPDPKQTAALIYTSGTTGSPRGVMLSHWNIVSNATAAASLFPIGPTDRSLSFLPWAHAFGQTVDLHLLLHRGVAVAINDDVTNLLTNLAVSRPTVLVAVPRVFTRIYDNVRRQIRRRSKSIAALFEAGVRAATRQNRGLRLSLIEQLVLGLAERVLFRRIRDRFGGALRFAICGAAALSREIAEFVNALGIDLYEGYGLTEASPVVSANAPAARRFGTVGRPLPGITVTIDRTAALDPKQGEILVVGPNVMQGYFGLPLESAEVLSDDGALRTGDLGFLDDDGYLVISGRVKEQYKLENGKYVVPESIEVRLRSSPLIANCLVYGADRPYNVVLVVPEREGLAQRAGLQNTQAVDSLLDPTLQRWILQEVRALCRELRAFERPKRICIVEEDFSIENGLLTPTLKPKRTEIVRRYQSKLDALYETSEEVD